MQVQRDEHINKHLQTFQLMTHRNIPYFWCITSMVQFLIFEEETFEDFLIFE